MGPVLNWRENLLSVPNAMRLKMMAPNAPQKQVNSGIIQKIRENPNLLRAINNPELRSLLEKSGQSDLPKVAQDQKGPPDEMISLKESQRRFIEAQ
jgi:hypothetical protein